MELSRLLGSIANKLYCTAIIEIIVLVLYKSKESISPNLPHEDAAIITFETFE